MKSVIIAGVLGTLVAAVPPPVELNQPDASPRCGSPIANATTQVAASGDCYTSCRNHCIKIWAIGTFPFPLTWPFVVWRCVHKCNKKCRYENAAVDDSNYDDDDGNKDTILHFAIMLQANGTNEVDMERLKEALDMDMVD